MGICLSNKNQNKLPKEDLEFLLKNTSYDKKTLQEWFRGFKQDCPKGRLTRAKFVQMYQMFFPKGSASQFCDHVFRTFDSDGNGFIDFREFMLAIGVTSSGSPEDKLKWAFRLYDVDGDGVVKQKEMTNIIQAIYDMMGSTTVEEGVKDTAEERAKNIFSRMDIDQDGSLTMKEFLSGCLEDTNLAQILAPKAFI